ncbi:9738_t:CDS:2 [Entrophospora sp. SA101]|nr:9738_t:CDS:2 [Entrophospora sp. SA101]
MIHKLSDELNELDFLLLKEEDLCYIGLSLGPAKRIAQLIKEISRTSLIDKPSTNLDTYLLITQTSGLRESILLAALSIQCGRKLGGAPFLIGSRPPPNDSLWSYIKDQGFEVNVFDWDITSHREKEADIELALSVAETITLNDPGILIIIAGDRDYKPVVKRALELNWTVETWFWNLGASISLKSNTIFCPLDNCYRSFSYGLGPDPSEKNQVLEITDGNLIRSLKNEDILEWFNTLNLFVHRNVPMTLIGFGFGTPIIPNTSRNSLARTWEASPSSKLYE